MSQLETEKPPIPGNTPDSKKARELTDADLSAKTNIIICYALFLASFLTGITFLIGGLWAYLKRSEAKDTEFADHYQNLIRTFWTSIILTIVGALTQVFAIGWFVLVFGAFYIMWKSVKGLSRITSNRAYY